MKYEDWNIPVGAAMFELADLLRDPRLQLTDRQRAALGAGRMALAVMAPGRTDAVTDDMVENALLGCPQVAQDAMAAAGFEPPMQVGWILQRGLSTRIHRFNRYRKDPEAAGRFRRRRS